jgi:hypothetical protein
LFGSISRGGRYVAFDSSASDLVPGDGNNAPDVYVRDLQAGTTTRVTIDTNGGDANNVTAVVAQPSLSADGRYVAFRSEASNLITDDTNGRPDVFVRDLVLHRTIRVSESVVGQAANGDSLYPSISGDGRFVAWPSEASDLVPRDRNRVNDVFVKYARAITVTGMSPQSVARGATNASVTITGTGFEPGDVVQVHRAGAVDITLHSVTVTSDSRITATVSIPSDAPSGAWDVRVWKIDGLGFAVGQCVACLQVT